MIKDYLNLDEIPSHAHLTKAPPTTNKHTNHNKLGARGTSPPRSPPHGGRDGMNPKLLTRGMEPPPPSQSGVVVEYLLQEVGNKSTHKMLYGVNSPLENRVSQAGFFFFFLHFLYDIDELLVLNESNKFIK